MMEGRLVALALALCPMLALGAAEQTSLSDPAWLPPGWNPRQTTALGDTQVASLPALAGRARGRVVLAARSQRGQGDLFVAEVDAPLKIDEDAREALRLAGPEMLRHLWGVEVEVTWVDRVRMGDVETLQLQGRLLRLDRTLRLAAIPAGEHHLVVVLTWPSDSASELAHEAERVLLALPRPRPAPRPFWTAGTTGIAVLGVVLLGLGARALRGRLAHAGAGGRSRAD